MPRRCAPRDDDIPSEGSLSGEVVQTLPAGERSLVAARLGTTLFSFHGNHSVSQIPPETSFQSGFALSMRATRFDRRYALICFSLAIAVTGSSYDSTYTNRSTL